MRPITKKLFELIPTDDEVLSSFVADYALENSQGFLTKPLDTMKTLLSIYEEEMMSVYKEGLNEDRKEKIKSLFYDLKVILCLCAPLLNRCDEKGNTLLHFAAERSFLNSVEFLLYCGADITICNKCNQTAQDLAYIAVSWFKCPVLIVTFFEENKKTLVDKENSKVKAGMHGVVGKENSKEKASIDGDLVNYVNAYPTMGDGNCALHALLGNLNASNTYFYHDANTVRKELADKICKISNEKDSVLFPCVLQNISDFVMQNEEDIYENLRNIKLLQEKYHELVRDKDRQIEEAKEMLMMFLLSVSEKVVSIRNQLCRIESSQEVDDNTLLSYFIECYTKDETRLYSLFEESPDLKTSYEAFTQLTGAEIDVESILLADNNLRKDVFADYAQYISKSQQWLSPGDLQLFAFFKGIHVVYYPDPNAKPAHFNETAQTTVGIMFDGRNHYSRVPTTPEEQNELNPLVKRLIGSAPPRSVAHVDPYEQQQCAFFCPRQQRQEEHIDPSLGCPDQDDLSLT